MRLTIRKIDGSSVEIDTGDAVLVRDLRSQIAETVFNGSNPESIRLIFLGRVLGSDEVVLSDLNISDGAVIHAIVSPRANGTTAEVATQQSHGTANMPGSGILVGVASMDDRGNIRLLSPLTSLASIGNASNIGTLNSSASSSTDNHTAMLYPNNPNRFTNLLEQGLATISLHTRDMNRQADIGSLDISDPAGATATALENLAGALSSAVPSIISMSSNLRHLRLSNPHSAERISSLRRIGDLRLMLDRVSSASQHVSSALGELSFIGDPEAQASSPPNQQSSTVPLPSQPRQIHVQFQSSSGQPEARGPVPPGALSSAHIEQLLRGIPGVRLSAQSAVATVRQAADLATRAAPSDSAASTTSNTAQGQASSPGPNL